LFDGEKSGRLGVKRVEECSEIYTLSKNSKNDFSKPPLFGGYAVFS